MQHGPGSETVLSIPVRIKVGFDSEALALEGSHIIGFRRMLLMLVATQVHLPSQLLHPNVRLPPAEHKTHASHALPEFTGEAASDQVCVWQ